jgi:hypothetical protein
MKFISNKPFDINEIYIKQTIRYHISCSPNLMVKKNKIPEPPSNVADYGNISGDGTI